MIIAVTLFIMMLLTLTLLSELIRSSALGTMSVQDTVSLFSTETVLAAKQNDLNEAVSKGLDDTTKFLSKL
jgi:hypothetical protein